MPMTKGEFMRYQEETSEQNKKEMVHLQEENDKANRVISGLVAVLENIADNSVVCLGPDCPYCVADNHCTQSWEAKAAQKILTEIGLRMCAIKEKECCYNCKYSEGYICYTHEGTEGYSMEINESHWCQNYVKRREE